MGCWPTAPHCRGWGVVLGCKSGWRTEGSALLTKHKCSTEWMEQLHPGKTTAANGVKSSLAELPGTIDQAQKTLHGGPKHSHADKLVPEVQVLRPLTRVGMWGGQGEFEHYPSLWSMARGTKELLSCHHVKGLSPKISANPPPCFFECGNGSGHHSPFEVGRSRKLPPNPPLLLPCRLPCRQVDGSHALLL